MAGESAEEIGTWSERVCGDKKNCVLRVHRFVLHKSLPYDNYVLLKVQTIFGHDEKN